MRRRLTRWWRAVLAQRPSPSQRAVRVLGLVVGLALLVVVPPTQQLGGATALLVAVTVLAAALRPEPVAGAGVVPAAALHLLANPVTAASPAVVAAAAVVAAQLSCQALTASAPPAADLDPSAVRRWTIRWVAMTGTAAVTWLAWLGATRVPVVDALPPVVAAVVALLALAACAVALLGSAHRR